MHNKTTGDSLLLKLLYSTGARVGEICQLKTEDNGAVFRSRKGGKTITTTERYLHSNPKDSSGLCIKI